MLYEVICIKKGLTLRVKPFVFLWKLLLLFRLFSLLNLIVEETIVFITNQQVEIVVRTTHVTNTEIGISLKREAIVQFTVHVKQVSYNFV